MIIYFVFKNNEIVYIGQTKSTIEKRKSQHEINARNGRGFVIGAAIRKHGKELFTWKLHSIHYNQVDLDAAEKQLIAKYKPRYNINLGGEARGGRKKSGKPAWNKGRKGQIAWNKGLKETRPEVLARIKASASSRDSSNRTMSEEHKTKIQEGRREAYKRSQTPFICHQNKKIYILVVDAARDLRIAPSGIYSVLNPEHPMQTYKGYAFSYINVRAA